jgi:hypothetical protein
MMTALSPVEKNSIAARASDGNNGRMRKASTPMLEGAKRSLWEIRYIAGKAPMPVIS